MFFSIKSILFWGLLVFSNTHSFIQLYSSSVDGSNSRVCPDIRPRLEFTFTMEGEYFDSNMCMAERYAIYKQIYHAFETNPLNFKNLDKGPMVLQFTRNGSLITFDSIVAGATPKNRRTMHFLGRNIELNAITDKKTILIELFIRKSSRSSYSLDTLDLLSAKNKFKIKTASSFCEKGQIINKTSILDSILRPYHRPKKKYENDLEVIYECPIFQAQFIGGQDQFIEYLADHFMIPPQMDEDQFQCMATTVFTVNQEGVINSVEAISHSPHSGYASNLLDKEIKRILLRSPRWKPKNICGQYTASEFCLKLKIYYND